MGVGITCTRLEEFSGGFVCDKLAGVERCVGSVTWRWTENGKVIAVK
jgi:hypothetical protein